MELQGYEIGALIHAGHKSSVYRARRQSDGKAVILKAPTAAHPSADELQRYKREFAAMTAAPHPGVVLGLEMARHRGSLVLVLADDGAMPLSEQVKRGPCDLRWFLTFAPEVVDAIGHLHADGWVHRDLNPANIVMRPDGSACIIDLGIAERVIGDGLPCESLVGTAAYLAPEQSGRMNRHVDQRADFYALGATFYTLLAGRTPFATTDLLELVHCHIARHPPQLTELRPTLPPIIGRLCEKLMAKAPEARYQSAAGLAADLRRAREMLDQDGWIENFPLGMADLAASFRVPDKLYGREAEVGQILGAFHAVADGGPTRLVAVAGHSGSGKSRLVREVQRPIVAKRGTYAAGKFDQFQRSTPLASVLAALDEVVRELLGQSESRLERWRSVLREALGQNLSLLVDVIPSLFPLLGPGLPVPELPPVEAQARFAQVFRQFVGALAAPEHPLVLFLDDLQWADGATLAWLEDALGPGDIRGLLLVVAYRDNEVGRDHPVSLLLDRLEAANARLDRVSVGPLPASALAALVSDALHSDEVEVQPLVAEVARVTDGNAFFVNQLLRHLVRHGVIVLDHELARWTFDLAALARVAIPDDVVELLVTRLGRLAEADRRALTVASVIGARFGLVELAALLGVDEETARGELEGAIAEGLLLEAGDGVFRFLHDRVQQAARQALAGDEDAELRLALGRTLLAGTPEPEHSTRLFEIVGHLEAGRGRIADVAERTTLSGLLFTAARRAREAGAFAAARDYVTQAMAHAQTLGGADTPSRANMERVLERAVCEHLAGDNAAADRHFESAYALAPDAIVRADAYEAQAHYFTNLGRFPEAYATARRGAAELGVSMPAGFVPPLLIADLAGVRLALGNRSVGTLADLPAVTDEKVARAIRLISPALKAAYQIRPELCVHNAARLVRLALKHGNTRDMPVAYFVFGGIFLGGILGLHDRGREFAALALNLIGKYDATHQKAETHFITGYFANSWWEPSEATEALWRTAYQSGKETGDSFHASAAASGTVQSMLMRGAPLDSILDRVDAYRPFLEQTHQRDGQAVMTIVQAAALALAGKTASVTDWSTPERAEAEITASVPGFGSRHFAHFYAVDKAMTLVLGRDPAAAIQTLVDAAPYLKDSTGMLHGEEHRFWHAMAAAIQRDADPRTSLTPLRQARRRFTKWTRDCPGNFASRAALMDAEWARQHGKTARALDLYDRAMELAAQHGHLHIEALANERAASLGLAVGRTRTARFQLSEALWCYTRWGAGAVVARMRADHPELANALPDGARMGATIQARTASSSTSTHGSSDARLDMVSVMKFADEIGSELSLAGLMERLVALLLEAAGAERGVLLLATDDGLQVEAEGRVDGQITVLQSSPLHSYDGVPHSLVHLCQRTNRPVVLADVRAGGPSSDPYLLDEKLRSIMALPLSYGGEPVGVIYLENNLAAGVFTDARLSVLGLLSGQIAVSIRNARLYHNLELKVQQRTAEIERERERAESLLLNILPRSTAAELKATGEARARSYAEVSVMFCDFANFTRVATGMTPEALIRLLDACFCAFDELTSLHGIEKIKTIGDAYMCAGGLPVADPSSSVRTVLCAIQMVAHIENEFATHAAAGEPFWRCRIGVHTGPVVAGVVGRKKFAYDVWGDAVNTASRMESHGHQGAVSISPATHALVSGFFACRSLGTVTVKGKGEMEMFQVDRLLPEFSADEVGLQPNAAFATYLAEWSTNRDVGPFVETGRKGRKSAMWNRTMDVDLG